MNERQLTDEEILETFRAARDAHTQLLNKVGKMHETLSIMSERLDLLQQRIIELEKRLERAQL